MNIKISVLDLQKQTNNNKMHALLFFLQFIFKDHALEPYFCMWGIWLQMEYLRVQHSGRF